MDTNTKLIKPGANEPCPCGYVDTEHGKTFKFKRCCGSPKGDLVYFVAWGEEALTNADGRVLIFKEAAIAYHVASREGWTSGELIPMAPHRFEKFKAAIPYVMVVTKDFEIDKKPDEKPEVKPIPATSLAHLMAEGVIVEKPPETMVVDSVSPEASNGKAPV